MRRQSISAIIAATTVIGLPAANAVAAITASPSSSASVKEKAKAAATNAQRAAAAKAAAAKTSAATASAATTTTRVATTTTPGGYTIGPPLDIMPTPAKAKSSAPTGEHTYVGDPVEMDQWGPVTVTIVVENGKIIESTAEMPLERPRSNFINTRVEPYLNSQAVKLQSAKLDLIGGATRACFAYAGSLQSAIDKAGLKP